LQADGIGVEDDEVGGITRANLAPLLDTVEFRRRTAEQTTASSSVSACRSRTQWARRCVQKP
jgi:hypothetical protein